MCRNNKSRAKFALIWAFDLSKGILILIAFFAAIKILLNPGEDTFDIMAWRILQATLVVIPTVIFGGFIYGYINYEEIREVDKKKEK